MSKYDGLRDYQKASAEVKLAVMRSEMIIPIETIRGYAEILRRKLDAQPQEVDEDFEEYLAHIVKAGDNLREILEILTGSLAPRNNAE